MLYRLEKGETRNNSVTTILSSGRKMTRPYSLDPSINNLTYATLNEAQYRDSVDGRYMGEIWAAVLLELMWNLVDKYKMRREIWPLLRKDKPGVPTDGCVLLYLFTQNLLRTSPLLLPCEACRMLLTFPVGTTTGDT